MEQLAEQKLLINSRMQLELQAEKQFGADIQQAADRTKTLEETIEAMRQEIVDLEEENRYVWTGITCLGSGCPMSAPKCAPYSRP